MKVTITTTLLLLIAFAPGIKTADPVTVKDPDGDAKFKGKPLPAFDLQSVTFEGHHDGEFVDNMVGGELDSIRVFNANEE